jgi:exonuclease VII large subunit
VVNRIILEGVISRINREDNKYIWFDICRNDNYKDKNGEMRQDSSFFSARIDKSKLSDLRALEKGKFVVVNGIPKSYIDKNNYKSFYIHVLSIEEYSKYKEKETISYDKDGVMLWNGQRCESEPASPEEIKEMEAI